MMAHCDLPPSVPVFGCRRRRIFFGHVWPRLAKSSCLSLGSSLATITLDGLWGELPLSGLFCILYRFQARFSLKLGQFYSS
jgi:hypothetical protein